MPQHNTTTVVVQHVQNGQTIGWLQWRNIVDTLCMIKTFQGGRGDDTFKTPSPYEQLLPLPTTCFKMFWKDSLMIPHHPTSSIFHCYPLPIHHPYPPPPPTNFDHTPCARKKRLQRKMTEGYWWVGVQDNIGMFSWLWSDRNSLI